MSDTDISAHHRLFETEHLQRDLRGRSVRGAAVTLSSQAARFVLQLAGMAVLARLLAPADFGVYGKTIALTGFITVLQSGGLSLATVQQVKINHGQVSTLFWLNGALGLAIGLVVAALSPAMAWFYRDPRVLWIGVGMAGVVLINSLGVQHRALLQRQMRFTQKAGGEVLALLAGFIAAVISAWMGAGYWAFVVQQYANALVTLATLYGFCRWLPGLPRRGSGVRPMVKLGANQSGSTVLNFASRNVDNILIGRYVSDAALGFYTLAYRLLLLPIQQINAPFTAVMLPVLARLQDQPRRFARFYYSALGAIVFVGMPTVCFLFVDAKPLIKLALGDRWLPTVPLFQALGVAAFIGTFNIAAGWVYLALGYAERQLRWQLVSTGITLAAFYAGLPWGAFGIAVSFSATRVLLIVPGLLNAYRDTPVDLRSTARTLARPALASIGAAVVLWGIHPATAHWSAAWVVIVDALLYAGLYLAAWLVDASGRAHLREFLTMAEDLRPGAAGAGKRQAS
ncbi:lipopolysaccharide biosynthesis protein [Frateuria terrea]|uniref:Polysaccharide transporter, PST family n=1 Tax=Frateuria terrea TaxID=529704 RepID=A0A1H6ZAE4_9GAMM|nr:lipopolysaccharide biosynthesis protein [Frateuria terrea]SEJ45845.1 polysaccharide transporter, PST family [Frateuria terrea]SFP76671.1 polysaccharide transporter, PST family [Frateuria terrea]